MSKLQENRLKRLQQLEADFHIFLSGLPAGNSRLVAQRNLEAASQFAQQAILRDKKDAAA